jgi:uncharacterized protein (TIGR02246 family)
MSSISTTSRDLEAGAVTAVLDQFYRAWAAADAGEIASLYTEDATAVMPGVHHQSRADVLAFFTAGFAGRLRGSTAADESRSVVFPAADIAIVVSEGGILMPGEASVPAGRLVRATWVLVRRSGTWRIAAYHNCALHGA